MNWLDIAIVIVVAVSTLQGRQQGVPRALLPLAGVLVGTLATGILCDDLARNISTIVTNDRDALAVGFLAIFASVYLGSQLITAISAPLTALLLLPPWTRTMGMVIGLVAGLLLVDTLLIFFVTYPYLGLEGAIRDSTLAPWFIDDFPVMRFLLPNEFAAAVAGFKALEV